MTLAIHAGVVCAVIAASMALPSGRGNRTREPALQVVLLPASNLKAPKQTLAKVAPKETQDSAVVPLGRHKTLVSMRAEQHDDRVETHGSVATADISSRSDFLAYRRQLTEHLRPFHSYPEGLGDKTARGVVLVGFMMRRDGAVREAWVETSSGSGDLDMAAVMTIRRAQPLPGIPIGLPESLVMTIPLSYSPRLSYSSGSGMTP